MRQVQYNVSVISPANHFLFTPFLPQTCVGTLEFRVVQEPVRTIPGLSGYYQAKARNVDFENRTIEAEEIFHDGPAEAMKKHRFEIPWDILVLST